MDKAKLDRCQDQLLVKYAFKKQRNSKRYIRVGDEVKQYVCFKYVSFGIMLYLILMCFFCFEQLYRKWCEYSLIL